MTTLGALGGGGTVTVTAARHGAWTATSRAPWLTVTSGASGAGNRPVGYSVATSTDWAPRTATLTVGGQVVTVTQAPPASTETRFYYDTDIAGSVTQITNSAGAVVAAYDYLPFGTQIAPPAFANTVQFAGQERDAETQLDYFGARYYSDQAGRFLAVDPVMDTGGALVNPQLWNRYAYALNNPCRFIDPDGSDVFKVDIVEVIPGLFCAWTYAGWGSCNLEGQSVSATIGDTTIVVVKLPADYTDVSNGQAPDSGSQPGAGPGGGGAGIGGGGGDPPKTPTKDPLTPVPSHAVGGPPPGQGIPVAPPRPKDPWYTSCSAKELGWGAVNIAVDAIGLIPEGTVVSEWIGNRFGRQGVAAGRFGDARLEEAQRAAETLSSAKGVEDTSGDGLISTGLSGAGFFARAAGASVAGQYIAGATILFDAHRIGKDVGQCP